MLGKGLGQKLVTNLYGNILTFYHYVMLFVVLCITGDNKFCLKFPSWSSANLMLLEFANSRWRQIIPWPGTKICSLWLPSHSSVQTLPTVPRLWKTFGMPWYIGWVRDILLCSSLIPSALAPRSRARSCLDSDISHQLHIPESTFSAGEMFPCL